MVDPERALFRVYIRDQPRDGNSLSSKDTIWTVTASTVWALCICFLSFADLFNIAQNLLVPSINPNVLQCISNTRRLRTPMQDNFLGNFSQCRWQLEVFVDDALILGWSYIGQNGCRAGFKLAIEATPQCRDHSHRMPSWAMKTRSTPTEELKGSVPGNCSCCWPHLSL